MVSFGPESAFVTSVERNCLTVSALHDFSGSGTGAFSFDPVSRFQVIGVDDSVETTSDATPIDIANAGSVSISITGGLSKRRVTISCSSPRDGEVEASIEEARALASHAVEYIKKNGADTLYKAYFGDNPTRDVITNFGFIIGMRSHNFKEAYCVCDPIIVTSVNPDVYNTAGTGCINFCEPFFDQKSLTALCKKEVSPTAKNLRGGSTLRMLARTYAPGVAGEHRTCEQSRGLSDFDKITNNDNYEASTQTLHYLPRARVLTRNHDLCSASLPRPMPGMGVKWAM